MMGLACLATRGPTEATACCAVRVERRVANMRTVAPIRVVRSVAITRAIGSIRVVRSVAEGVAGCSRRHNVPIRLRGRRTCSYQCNTAYQCLNLIHRKFLKLVVPSMAVRSSVTPTVSAMGLRKD